MPKTVILSAPEISIIVNMFKLNKQLIINFAQLENLQYSGYFLPKR